MTKNLIEIAKLWSRKEITDVQAKKLYDKSKQVVRKIKDEDYNEDVDPIVYDSGGGNTFLEVEEELVGNGKLMNFEKYSEFVKILTGYQD